MNIAFPQDQTYGPYNFSPITTDTQEHAVPYTEAQFKSWLIAKGALYYKIDTGQLTLNPWEKGAKDAHLKAGVGVTFMSTNTGWRVYKKCYEEKEDMIMGRLKDTELFYRKFGLGSKDDPIYNLDQGKHIHVQKLKNWTTVINDCWILGAVNACKTFHLVSGTENGQTNIWDGSMGMFFVTGRELTGLRLFGYRPIASNRAKIAFAPGNTKRAENATFQEYAEFMNKAANSQIQKTKTALFAQGVG